MAEEMKVWAKKIGSLWHGYHRDFPQIDERGLTEELAKKKARELGDFLERERNADLRG